MLPPWVTYLVALTGWPDAGWIEIETLKLGMGVEWVSAAVFPLLVGLALDSRPPRVARLAIAAASGIAVTLFVRRAFGDEGAGLFWINGVVTYAGWLWAQPGESRLETLLSRWLLTFGCLIPLLFSVIVLSKLAGVDDVLLLGLLYFLTLHALELTGTFSRFARAFQSLRAVRRWR